MKRQSPRRRVITPYVPPPLSDGGVGISNSVHQERKATSIAWFGIPMLLGVAALTFMAYFGS